MEIKVLGSGCSRCHKALEVVQNVLVNNNVEADLEYVTDMMRIMEYNVMSMPAVVVDGQVKLKGKVPSESEVKEMLGL